MSTSATPETTPTGEAPDAQDTQTAPAPDGEQANVGQDQSTAQTLLTTESAPVVPDSFELTLPENTLLDPTVTERVTAIAKELGVTDAAHAQRVLDAIHGEADTALKTFQAAIAKGGDIWKENVARLAEQSLADPEIGGTPDLLNRSVSSAKSVLAKYATKEFVAWLDETGQGSHPEVIRTFARIAKAFGEDTLMTAGDAPRRPKTVAEKLFPNLPPQ